METVLRAVFALRLGLNRTRGPLDERVGQELGAGTAESDRCPGDLIEIVGLQGDGLLVRIAVSIRAERAYERSERTQVATKPAIFPLS
jgi:hypothetical protein